MSDVMSLSEMMAPYVLAAVEVYGRSVLNYMPDHRPDEAAALGRRLLLRVFGPRAQGEPLPQPLADLVTDPADENALAAARLSVRQALNADPVLVAEIRSMLAGAVGVTQQMGPRRDAYSIGETSSTVREYPDNAGQLLPPGLTRRAPRAPRSQMMVGDVPQELRYFQPRPKLEAELERSDLEMPVVRAVTGVRGAGKTQLAATYARARLDDGWRLVAWVNAENRDSLRAGMAAISDAIGLAERVAGGDSELGRLVRHWLETNGERCLVVFDNATDPNALPPFMPAGGAAMVLITTGRSSIASLWPKVKVEVFSRKESTAFLVGRTGQADSTAAAMVASKLGHLPLALAHAAALIVEERLSYQEYLEQLQTTPVESYAITKRGKPLPPGVAQAIRLSLNAVTTGSQGEVCVGLLEFIAVVSAGGIRRDLAYAAGRVGSLIGDDGAEVSASLVDAALSRLAEQSFLTFSLDSQTVVVHELIRQVLRVGLTKQGRLAAVCRAAALGLRTYTETLAGSEDYSAIRDLAEQVTALQESAEGLSSGDDVVLASLLLGLRLWMFYHLNELGHGPAQAVLIGEPLTADFERVLGPDHPNTLASQNNLANAYREVGRVSEAVALLEQTVAARERVLGSHHPFTLDTRNNLAAAYVAAGRAAEAILLHEKTLAAREEELGSDHLSTLQSRNNLAIAYQDAGRAAEAILQHEQTLAARERLLGLDHPLTLSSRNNLATAYYEAGWTAEAISIFEQILAARKGLLGPNHPETLASRNNLAAAYQDSGRTTEAIPLLQQTLAAYKRVLGPEHPDTLASQSNLAAAYQDSGRTTEAIPLLQQTLAAYERVLGPDHPLTLASRDSLAAVNRDADQAG